MAKGIKNFTFLLSKHLRIKVQFFESTYPLIATPLLNGQWRCAIIHRFYFFNRFWDICDKGSSLSEPLGFRADQKWSKVSSAPLVYLSKKNHHQVVTKTTLILIIYSYNFISHQYLALVVKFISHSIPSIHSADLSLTIQNITFNIIYWKMNLVSSAEKLLGSWWYFSCSWFITSDCLLYCHWIVFTKSAFLDWRSRNCCSFRRYSAFFRSRHSLTFLFRLSLFSSSCLLLFWPYLSMLDFWTLWFF